VQPNPLNPPDAEEREAVIMLEPPELALDGGAAAVEAAPLVAAARDAEPPFGLSLAERDDRGAVALVALRVDTAARSPFSAERKRATFALRWMQEIGARPAKFIADNGESAASVAASANPFEARRRVRLAGSGEHCSNAARIAAIVETAGYAVGNQR
jgi:hypothetical protein